MTYYTGSHTWNFRECSSRGTPWTLSLVHQRGVTKEAYSAVGFKELAKKVIIFALMAVGSLLDKVIPAANNAIRAALCMFYIANEELSVSENAGVLGLPLPTSIEKVACEA